MSKGNPLYLKLSIIISIVLSIFIPSNPINEGILKYNYGLPFAYITIYQRGETSAWFFNNFFNGNTGILIDPLTAIINIIVLYYVICYLAKLFIRKG